MCLFPNPNLQFNGLAYKKGIHEFDCGACPECLRKRSNIWVLRSVYESKLHVNNCMVTLTYDNFAYDDKGNVIGELPVNRDLKVNQRDIQLFIKRLRKHFCGNSKSDIKYIACAEYGSHTHRAHYHLILFGVDFSDKHYYKRSKRGNPIYMSSTLTKLWKHGICTIDSIQIRSAVARYCTKYCAKSRSDKTFMLASQRLGFESLKCDFNGKSYYIDGREYPVPRFIWQDYIVNKYQRRYLFLKNAPLLSPKYVNPVYDEDRNFILNEFEYERSKKQRAFYRKIRDKDPLYVSYLGYWKTRGEAFSQNLNSKLQRINLLDDRKFHFYKVAALEALGKRQRGEPVIAPGSGCISYYFCYLYYNKRYKYLSTCPYPSRPNRTSDTLRRLFVKDLEIISDIPPFKMVQASIFD